MRRIFVICILVLSNSGCDWVNGVSHISSITALPEKSCVEEALLAVPDISEVQYSLEDGSKELTFSGVQKPEKIHRYSYQYSNLNGGFYFVVNYKGEVEFHHSYLYMNATPPQEEIELIRPLMFLVEKELENKCNVNFMTKPIRERCSNVECG